MKNATVKSAAVAKKAPVAAAPAQKPRRATVAKTGTRAAPKAAAASAAPVAKPTAAKPIEKTVEVKEKTVKAKKAVVAFVPRTLPKGKPVFVIAVGPRPTSGTRLYAHTHAALTMLGMMDNACPAVPKSAVLSIMGQRALSYHLKEGNFVDAKDHGIRLTAPGLNKFRNRMAEGKVDAGLANDFLALFIDGTVAPSLQLEKGEVFQVALG